MRCPSPQPFLAAGTLLRAAPFLALIVAAGSLMADARAESVSGRPYAIDGDTLRFGRSRVVRIFGIDAPERDQICGRADGSPYPAGAVARQTLTGLIAGGMVRCDGDQPDQYGRLVATCEIGGIDLGEAMVAGGHAIAFRHFSEVYAGPEQEARASRRGIWQGACDEPYAWRRARRS